MKTILVTGCNGQLGSELKSLENNFLKFNFLFASHADLDLSSTESINTFCQDSSFDYCINAGAYTKVDLAEKESELCFAINAEGVKTLAQNCFDRNIPFIHFSSDYVFDGKGNTPYKENEITNPVGQYALSKEKGEQLLQTLAQQTPLAKFTIVRTSWVYSSFGNNFVKTMIRLMKERESLGVVCDQIGSPTYAKDLAILALQIIENWEKGKSISSIYHFSNEGVCSWYEFAKAIAEYIDYKGELKAISTAEYPTPAPRPAYSVLDKTKIKAELNINIRHWEDALDECLQILNP